MRLIIVAVLVDSSILLGSDTKVYATNIPNTMLIASAALILEFSISTPFINNLL